MSSSPRNLDTASLRFQAAEQSSIDCIGVAWPSFAKFEAALSDYIEHCDSIAYDDERRAELQALRLIRHRLSRVPIHPNHDSIELNALPLDTSPIGIEDPRSRCLRSARELLGTPHPAADIHNLIRANSSHAGRSLRRVAVVAPETFHGAIRDCIDLGDLNYALVSQSQLKHQGVWDLAIYLGPQYSSYPGTPLELRKKRVAWMYSAPAAPWTIQVIWSGTFEISDFTLWTESPVDLRKSAGPTRFRVFIDEMRPPPPPPPPSFIPTDGVSGLIIDVAGGYRVALSPEYGPRAHVMQVDDFAVSIEAESADRISTGDTLLLRVDRTAREFVMKSAETAMRNAPYRRARDASSRFKRQVTDKAAENRTAADARLRNVGIANSAYYLNACADDAYIGPNTLERYRNICVALGIEHSDDDFKLIKSLRTAHRKSGLTARERIQTELKVDRTWEEETREHGFVVRDFADLGKILIAAIIAITPRQVSLSSLGRVQKDGNFVDQ